MRTTSDDFDTHLTDDQTLLFVRRVQARAEVSEAEARALSRTTLRHLGEHISPATAQALSGALPDGLADEVTASRNQAASVDAGAFLDAVATHVRAASSDEVEQRVRAVLSTVRAWAPDGQIENTLAELPPGLAVLFA